MQTLVVPTDGHTVSGPAQGTWTTADWEKLPDDGNRYEIVDGVLYVTTAPSTFHGWILRQFDQAFIIPGEKAGLGYGFSAPVGLFMPQGGAVQPDFLFVRKENAGIIRDRRIFGAPDLIVEVLSPSNRAYDEGIKLRAYEAASVAEYAVIDPAARTLNLYRLADGVYGPAQAFTGDQVISFGCLPGIEAALSSLFAGAPDTTI